MAKHPTSSRVHREDPGPDDAFVSTIKRGYHWGRENGRVVGVVLGVVVLVAIGALWYTSQQRQLEAQAATRLSAVQQSVASGNTQLAIRDLQAYLDRFGGTETANQARLLLAGILLSEDQGQQALEALGELPQDLDEPFGLAAARLQAAAYEALGQVDEAVSTYRRIANEARFPFERREALADAARVQLQNGQADNAVRLYQQVVDSFAEDEQGRGYYEMWLAEARAQAEKGVVASTGAQDTSTASQEPDEG